MIYKLPAYKLVLDISDVSFCCTNSCCAFKYAVLILDCMRFTKSTQVSKIAIERKNNSNVSKFEASNTIYGIHKLCEAHQKVPTTQIMDFVNYVSHNTYANIEQKTVQKESSNTIYGIHKLCCELRE